MKLKEVDRTANVAWSPAASSATYMAAGTAAQQLDSSFSSNAVLELYFFDINQPGLDMPLNASLPCDSRFHKLIWGCHGMTGNEDADPECPSGVIVAGCEGGVMQVYDAAKVLKNEDAIVLTKNKHTGPVRALDFNSFRPHIVASGASDSEIFIWDFNNPKTAMSTGTRSQPADDVTHLAWNKQVEHILASTFSTRCVMWDLRKNEPIIKVADTTSRIRYKVVEWHPTVATQMCLASEDDSNPVIQLWDLRYATSPLKVLQGHQRGVLGLSWCKQDEELLLSCGKDSNIMCWNPNYPHPGYELLCEIPTTSQWSFDVSFCPRNPLVFSSSSFDGRISVFGLSGGAQQPVTSSKLADSFPGMDMTINQTTVPAQKPPVQLRDAPKWLKRPCGASFAFGGKLINFENVKHSQNQPGVPDQRIVTISQVVTLPEFLERSQKLEASLATGNLGEFCEDKAKQTADENEARVWKYLRASFAPNPTYEYLEMLGYNPNDVYAKLGNLVGKGESSDKEVDALTDGFVSLAQGDSFGNPSQPYDSGRSFDGIAQKSSRTTTPGSDQLFEIHTDENPEGLLNQALLSGNIEYAVDLCMQEEHWPEAFVLASCRGPELTKRVQLKYFQECKSETSAMIRIIVSQDWKRLVERCDLKYWEQALATVLTHVGNENDFTYLAGTLGQRLENSDEEDLRKSAIICYICSGNMVKLAESWTSLKDSGKAGTTASDGANSLQDLVEQVTILRKAAEARGRREAVTSGPLALKIVEYAMLLASQGSLESALKYLADSTDPSMISLRERIQYSLGYQYQRPSGIAPRSRQTSESGLSSHRGSISLSQKRPSYTSSIPQSQHQYPAVSAPVVANGYGSNFNQQQLYNPPSNQPTPAAALPMPPVSSAAHGWNDPPSLTLKPPKPKASKTVETLEPITHPLFGSGPVPNNPGPPLGGLDSYQSNYPPGPTLYNSFPPTAPPTSFGSPNPISTSTYGAPAVPLFPSGGTSHNQNPLFNPGPPPSTYNPGSVSAFAPRSSLSGPPISSFTPGPPASLFTPGPPSSSLVSPSGLTSGASQSSGFNPGPPPSAVFAPGPPPSAGFNPGPPPSSGFTPGPPSSTFNPGPPPSSGFAPGPPPSSGFAPGPPPSSGFAPGPPPSSGFAPGPPPSSGFAPGPPPSSGFAPGPPPSSGFAPGPPPSSGFAPGPPPSSGFASGPPPSAFNPGPPPSTGFAPGLPPSSGFTSGPPPSSGFAPGPPPSTGFVPGSNPSSTFNPGPPLSNSFTPGPLPSTGFPPGVPPTSGSAANFPPPPSRTSAVSTSGFSRTSTPGLPADLAPTLHSQSSTIGSPSSFNPGHPAEPAASVAPPSSQGFAPPPPTSGFTPGPSISTPLYVPPPSLPVAPSADLGPISDGWDALSTGQQDGIGGPPTIQTLTPAPLPSAPFTSPQTSTPSPSLPPSAPARPASAAEAEPTKPTGAIPEEHKELIDVLEKLRSECYNLAGLPQIKRKLEDVARKMEILNEKLREKSLSENTLTSLHNIVDAMKNRDYQLALSIHTMLVTAGNFAEISSFLPSIKVLIQSAAQLNVFL